MDIEKVSVGVENVIGGNAIILLLRADCRNQTQQDEKVNGEKLGRGQRQIWRNAPISEEGHFDQLFPPLT